MNEYVQSELKKIFNGRFSTSESTRANYARGEDTYDPVLSQAVVFPETNEEVSEITEVVDEPKIDLDEYAVSNEMIINDADSLNDLLDSVDNTLQKAQNILDDASVDYEEEPITEIDNLENQVDATLLPNDEATVYNTEETLDLVSVLPKKKILNTIDENSLVEEANAARDLLTELNNTTELENKLAEEATQALVDLAQLIEEPTEVVSNAFSAQASDIEETELTIDTNDAEYVYIKIGSYTRGNSAFSFMTVSYTHLTLPTTPYV